MDDSADLFAREATLEIAARLHCFVTYYADWQTGLASGGLPMGRVRDEFPPDALRTVDYASFPGVFVPPYRHPNPVTGKAWRP